MIILQLFCVCKICNPKQVYKYNITNKNVEHFNKIDNEIDFIPNNYRDIYYTLASCYNHPDIDGYNNFINDNIITIYEYFDNLDSFQILISDMDLINYKYLLYYACLESKLDIVNYLMDFVIDYDIELLLRIIFRCSRDIVNYFIDIEFDVNYKNLYLQFLTFRCDMVTACEFVKKNNIVMTYNDFFYKPLSKKETFIIKNLYDNGLLKATDREIFKLCIKDIELCKYFVDVGHKITNNILTTITKNIFQYPINKYIGIELLNSICDDNLPPNILFAKYILCYENVELAIELLQNGHIQDCDIIDSFCYLLIECTDKNILDQVLEISIANKYFITPCILNDFINCGCSHELIYACILQNFYKIIQYAMDHKFAITTPIFSDFLVNNFEDLLIANCEKYFHVFAVIILDIDFVNNLVNYLPFDYDFTNAFIYMIRAEKMTTLDYLYKKLPDEIKSDYYNKIANYGLRNHVYKTQIDYVHLTLWSYITEFVINNYHDNLVINFNLLDIFIKLRDNHIDEIVIKILDNQHFTQSELDKLLNISLTNFKIYNKIIELGGDIYNQDSVLDLWIMKNLRQKTEFLQYHDNGDIDVFEMVQTRFNNGNRNLKYFIHDQDFMYNVVDNLNMTHQEYSEYVKYYK